MCGALTFARLLVRIAAVTCAARADAAASQVGNRSRKDAYARSLFTSLVFCDRIVKISSSRGSQRRGGVRGP